MGLSLGDADDIGRLWVEPFKLNASLRNEVCEPVQSTLISVLDVYSLSIGYMYTCIQSQYGVVNWRQKLRTQPNHMTLISFNCENLLFTKTTVVQVYDDAW